MGLRCYWKLGKGPLSTYPIDETYETVCPICPNCGYEFSTDDGAYYPKLSSEEEFEEDCPGCGLHLTIFANIHVTWSIEHPRVCDVKGYHIVFINHSGKKSCLYCRKPLRCKCESLAKCHHGGVTKLGKPLEINNQ